jgi:hypothetical protein
VFGIGDIPKSEAISVFSGYALGFWVKKACWLSMNTRECHVWLMNSTGMGLLFLVRLPGM